MKNRCTLRATAVLTICLLSVFVAAAQRKSKAQGGSIPPGPCHQNTNVCVRNMNSQISLIRAYASHLKPGDKVTFNPQPDPPGEPAFHRANEAYRRLEAEVSDLAGWSSETPNLKSRAAISDAQEKFGRLVHRCKDCRRRWAPGRVKAANSRRDREIMQEAPEKGQTDAQHN